MLERIRLWRERRRHDVVYGNPRSAKPKPVNTTWKRRAYWRGVVRILVTNLLLLFIIVGASVWAWVVLRW